MAEETLMQASRGASELRAYLKDPTEKDLLTMELGGYLPQLNLASAVGMRHISPALADLADAITDPISAALFGLGGKLLKAGVKGGSAALRAGVRGSIKAATSAEKVALSMAEKFAVRAGKGLETQSWEALRAGVAKGLEEGATAERIIGDLTDIKKNMPRWKASTGTQMTPSSRNIDHIIGAIHGEKPGLIKRLFGAKATEQPVAVPGLTRPAVKREPLPGLEVGKDVGPGDELMVPAHSLEDVVLEHYPVPDTLYHFTPSEHAGKELRAGEDNIIWFTGNKAENPLVDKKAIEMADAGLDIPSATREWTAIPAKQNFKKLVEVPGRILETPETAPKLNQLRRWADMGVDAVVDPERPEWFGYIGHLRTPGAKVSAGISARTGKGGAEEALHFIDEQIELRRTLHKDIIKAGQAGDVPGFLKGLDEVFQLEPSARMGILKKGAKQQMKLAEQGLAREPAAEFARMHPKIATLTPFKKAGLVPGGEAGAEAVARAQKWPVATQGFETVITGFAKLGEAVKGAAPPKEGAAATDIASIHIGDVQWGDVATSVVMRDFGQKFDLPARARIGRMIMDPEAAFEGVTKEIDVVDNVAGTAARERIRYKDVSNQPIGSLAGLTPKKGFGTNEAEILVADQLKATLEDTGKYLVEEDVIKGMLDNYFPRVIKNYGKVAANKESLSALERLKEAISKESTPGATGKLSGFSRHGLPRTMAYDELLKLEEKGLLQVEKDPARILNEYFRSVNKAAADKRAIDRLAHNSYPVTPSGAEGPTVGALLYPRGDPPPKSIAHLYELGSDPSLLSVARARYGMGITDKVWVLKEAHAPIRRAFGAGLYQGPAQSISEAALRGALVANSFAKRASMFMSMFHLVNLTESMVMDMGASFFNVRAFQRATKSLYNASDMMEFAVRSGMTVGPIVDAEWNVFSKAMVSAADWLKAKRIPLLSGKAGLEGVVRGWNAIDGAWNRFMWDYYQNSAKMMAFSEMYYDALRRFPNMKPNEIGESVAKHVNNAIGGINWERSWISKQGQQWARLLMFAPDYTLTNLTLAADVFAAKFVKAPGQRIPFKVLFEDSPQAYYARQFAFRARTIPAFMANHLNYALSAWRDGQGHWLHENDPGNDDRIEMPWLDEKGRKQYYRFGKQMREPMELVRMWNEYDGPWKFLRKKMGVIPQYFVTNFAGTDAVGQPVFTTKDGWVQKLGEELGYPQGQTRWIQQTSDRAQLAIEMGLSPIWARQAMQAVESGVPASAMALTLLGVPIYGGRKPQREPKPKNQGSFMGVR